MLVDLDYSVYVGKLYRLYKCANNGPVVLFHTPNPRDRGMGILNLPSDAVFTVLEAKFWRKDNELNEYYWNDNLYLYKIMSSDGLMGWLRVTRQNGWFEDYCEEMK